MTKKSIIMTAALLLISLTMISCNRRDDIDDKPKNVTVYCDDAVFPLIDTLLFNHDSLTKDINYKFVENTAHDCMGALLRGDADLALLSRDYTANELEQYALKNVEKKLNKPFAYDLLVFFTNKDSAIDTLSNDQVASIILENKKLTEIFPGIAEEPVFAIKDKYSSEIENLRAIIAKNKPIKKPLKVFSSTDSVMNFVADNNAIGIAYWSQLQGDDRFKCIRIGYLNEKGKYLRAIRVVHYSLLVKNEYPYKVTHYAYLADRSNPFSKKIFRFMIENKVSSKYFMDHWLLPKYRGLIILKEEE